MDDNVSQSIVVELDSADPNEMENKIALFNEDGTPYSPSTTGDKVLLTGMTEGSATAVDETDTVNEAIAKLQAQIDGLS